ncbi:MAG TPA: hypothetical protein VIV11_28090 [Kofleriaceae bacterium]
MHRVLWSLAAVLALTPRVAIADEQVSAPQPEPVPLVEPTRGLQTDTLLHPMDGFTGYTLKQGEFIYCQSPLTLPLPSWAWIGITDWLTAEIDLLPLLGGFLVEPHRPVPSFNFRFRLRDGGKHGISLAYETMVQHMWLPTEQENGPMLYVRRDGTQWFNRINASIPLTERFRIHVSAGATFSEDVEITNNDPMNPVGEHHINAWSPDASLSFDFRWKPWISLHATASMGTTFVYSDNQPNKLQAAWGYRLAPLYDSKRSILRTMRFEFPAFVMWHPESRTGWRWYLPIIPYVYWQWGG